MVNKEAYLQIKGECEAQGVTLVAVSKIKPNEDIMALYELGQRDFGENYVQELMEKHEALPKDIRWHFIGHLQSNKVKYITDFVHLIHGVDSEKLLKEVNKQAAKNGKVISCLLQMHIAKEETKFGMDETEVAVVMNSLETYKNVSVQGFMGMASFSDDLNVVKEEFNFLKSVFDKYVISSSANGQIKTLSMGMSGDYKLAMETGSNMVRIGSLLFGARL